MIAKPAYKSPLISATPNLFIKPHTRPIMTRWLDFSGAPPLLIPRRLLKLWHGGFDTTEENYLELNTENPRTDYDRACSAAWPGRGVLPLGNASALALYTEFDEHTWDDERKLVACGSWLPSTNELSGAVWSAPLEWEIHDSEFVLANSAASGAQSLNENEYLPVLLQPGRYVVEYAALEANKVGCFHRFKLIHAAPTVV